MHRIYEMKGNLRAIVTKSNVMLNELKSMSRMPVMISRELKNLQKRLLRRRIAQLRSLTIGLKGAINNKISEPSFLLSVAPRFLVILQGFWGWLSGSTAI